MLSRNEIILAKIEATYNTDSAPTNTANAVAVSDLIKPNPAENARFAERNVIRGQSIAKQPGLFGGSLFGIEFDVEVKGSGTLGTAPEYGPLLRACGLSETIVASTSVTYAPTSTFGANSSCTIYYWQEGVRYRLTGCRGTVSFRGTVGEVPKLSFKMVGHLTSGDPTDVAVPVPTLQTTVPPVFLGASFLTIGAYAPAFTELSLDLGNELVPAANANAANGYGEVRIASRDVRGTIDPEMTLVATNNWLQDWRNGTQRALSATIGSVAANRVAISVPRVQYQEPGFDDRDGTRVISLGFKAVESSSLNDELSLLFN